MAQFEKATVGENVSSYLETRKNILVAFLVVVIVAVAAYSTFVAVNSSSIKKGLALIDAIEYELTNGSADLSEEDLATRKTKALSDLSSLVKKGGVVGVRANMLNAEIVYDNEDFENAAKYWETAALKDKKAYTFSLCYFNAAVAYEQVVNLEKAKDCYKKAILDEDFLQRTHAQANLGRVMESLDDKDGAIEIYQKLYTESPDSSWGNFAKSRLIALEVQ